MNSGLQLRWRDGVEPEPAYRKNQPSAFENGDFVTTAVKELLQSGAVRVTNRNPHIVSPLGVAIHQRTQKKRLIFDLRFGVNENLKPDKFKYEGIHTVRDIAERSDCVFGLDLSSAYHHVDIDERYWKYLGFEWEGVFYEFCVLPFGLNIACYVFTKLVKPLAQRWRSVGIRVAQYIDDWLFFAPSSLHAEAVKLVLNDCKRAGWIVNVVKCSGLETPSKSIDWIGHSLDLAANTLRVMECHIKCIRNQGEALLKASSGVPARAVFRFVGKVCSTYHVSGKVGKLFTFFLRQSVRRIIENNYRNMDSFVRLCSRARAEIRELLQRICEVGASGITVPLLISHPFEADVIVGSDAGEPGWGGWLERNSNKSFLIPRLADIDEVILQAHGAFSLKESLESSTLRETLALSSVLASFLSFTENRNVLALVDSQNLRDIWYGGGSRTEKIHTEIIRLYKWCEEHNINLRVEWIPRDHNDLADYLSKWVDYDDWAIRHEIFLRICNRWGEADVDLFASHTNTRRSKFFSLRYTPGAAGVDAFTHHWGEFSLCWCNPPCALIGRVISHARRCKASIILLAPWTPQSPWWPTLRSRDGQSWAPFVRESLELPSGLDLFSAGSNSEAYGCGYPPFRMFALLIRFA